MNEFAFNNFFQSGYDIYTYVQNYSKKLKPIIKANFMKSISERPALYKELYQISQSACMRALYEETKVARKIPSKSHLIAELKGLARDADEIASEMWELSDRQIAFGVLRNMVDNFLPTEIARQAQLINKDISRDFYYNCRKIARDIIEEL